MGVQALHVVLTAAAQQKEDDVELVLDVVVISTWQMLG